jgi:hypothetical protein
MMSRIVDEDIPITEKSKAGFETAAPLTTTKAGTGS